MPTFDPPSCLEVEERSGGVVLSLVILQDRAALNAAFTATLRRGAAYPMPAAVAKGRCWEDIAELLADEVEAFRLLCADIDPCGLDDYSDAGGRDGIELWLRCVASRQSRTIYMWSPSRKTAPAHHRWITALLDLAATSFGDQACLDYLASVQRYLH